MQRPELPARAMHAYWPRQILKELKCTSEALQRSSLRHARAFWRLCALHLPCTCAGAPYGQCEKGLEA